MLIEILLSGCVITIFGAMIFSEWTSTPDPKLPKLIGWKGALQRADVLLAGCIGLCLGIIWLPALFFH
jgi:hypothetical protein